MMTSDSTISDHIGPVQPVGPDTARTAGVAVCAYAETREEAVELLAMLGITDTLKAVE